MANAATPNTVHTAAPSLHLLLCPLLSRLPSLLPWLLPSLHASGCAYCPACSRAHCCGHCSPTYLPPVCTAVPTDVRKTSTPLDKQPEHGPQSNGQHKRALARARSCARAHTNARAGLKHGPESIESDASCGPETSDAVHISTNMSILMVCSHAACLESNAQILKRYTPIHMSVTMSLHISTRTSVPTDLEYWTEDRKREGRYSAKPGPASSHQASSCSSR